MQVNQILLQMLNEHKRNNKISEIQPFFANLTKDIITAKQLIIDRKDKNSATNSVMNWYSLGNNSPQHQNIFLGKRRRW